MALKKYHFRVEHRPRTQHRNADGLSKRTKGYRWREQQLQKQPPAAERLNFVSQDEYEQLPVAPWFDVQGRVIPNHPDLPSHLRHMQPAPPSAVQRIVRRTQQTKMRERQKEALRASLPAPPPPVLRAHEDFHPEYPEDWIDMTEEASHDYLLPIPATNVASRTTYALAEASGQVLQNAPKMSYELSWPFATCLNTPTRSMTQKTWC